MNSSLNRRAFQFVSETLSDSELYKKKIKILKESVSSGDLETIENIITAIEYALLKQTGNPLITFHSIKLLKDGLDVDQYDKLGELLDRNNSILPRMFEIACFNSASHDDNRGAFYFGINSDANLKGIGNSLLRLTLECFLFWPIKLLNSSPSLLEKIKRYYERLIDLRVKFPSRIIYFRHDLTSLESFSKESQPSKAEKLNSSKIESPKEGNEQMFRKRRNSITLQPFLVDFKDTTSSTITPKSQSNFLSITQQPNGFQMNSGIGQSNDAALILILRKEITRLMEINELLSANVDRRWIDAISTRDIKIEEMRAQSEQSNRQIANLNEQLEMIRVNEESMSRQNEILLKQIKQLQLSQQQFQQQEQCQPSLTPRPSSPIQNYSSTAQAIQNRLNAKVNAQQIQINHLTSLVAAALHSPEQDQKSNICARCSKQINESGQYLSSVPRDIKNELVNAKVDPFSTRSRSQDESSLCSNESKPRDNNHKIVENPFSPNVETFEGSSEQVSKQRVSATTKASSSRGSGGGYSSQRPTVRRNSQNECSMTLSSYLRNRSTPRQGSQEGGSNNFSNSMNMKCQQQELPQQPNAVSIFTTNISTNPPNAENNTILGKSVVGSKRIPAQPGSKRNARQGFFKREQLSSSFNSSNVSQQQQQPLPLALSDLSLLENCQIEKSEIQSNKNNLSSYSRSSQHTDGTNTVLLEVSNSDFLLSTLDINPSIDSNETKPAMIMMQSLQTYVPTTQEGNFGEQNGNTEQHSSASQSSQNQQQQQEQVTYENSIQTENFATSCCDNAAFNWQSTIQSSEVRRGKEFFENIVYPFQSRQMYFNSRYERVRSVTRGKVSGMTFVEFDQEFIQKVSAIFPKEGKQYANALSQYRKAALTEKGVLLSNGVVKIGSIANCSEFNAPARFQLHFLNMSSHHFSKFSYSNLQDSDVSFQMNPSVVRCEIPPQHKVKCDVEVERISHKPILPTGRQGKEETYQIILPINYYSQMKPKKLEKGLFEQRWNALNSNSIFVSTSFESSMKVWPKSQVGADSLVPNIFEGIDEKEYALNGFSGNMEFLEQGVELSDRNNQASDSSYLLNFILHPQNFVQFALGFEKGDVTPIERRNIAQALFSTLYFFLRK